MVYEINEEHIFKFIETGDSTQPTLLLLHGLFGALSNFQGILSRFGKDLNVVVPILPIMDLPLRKVSIGGLLNYVIDFIKYKGYKDIHVLGNSLGGHISLLYVLDHQDNIATLTLTGSSGLFENSLGNSFPKRGNYEYIKSLTEATFFDPAVATKELVDEVFDTVNDRNKAIRIIATAKSAIRHNVKKKLHQVLVPTLLIWGKEDTVTPAFVGENFHQLIPNSELHILEDCGHAPMMELPDEFNNILDSFLVKQKIYS